MKLHVHYLGLQSYADIWHDMQQFTEHRTSDTDDEIWFVQHHPVFILGKNGFLVINHFQQMRNRTNILNLKCY